MKTIDLKTLENNLFEIIDEIIKLNKTIMVKTKRGNIVIVSEKDYDSILETVDLVSQPGCVEKITIGEKEDINSMAVYNSNEKW